MRMAVRNPGRLPATTLMNVALLTQLRTATRSRHERLESLPTMQRIFRQDYTRTEYIRLLQIFLSIYRPLEDSLTQPGRTMTVNLGYRTRSAELESDLCVLKADIPVGESPAPLPLFNSDAAEVGCLYVLEGSRHGGRVMAGHLAKTLDLTVDTGLRFLTGADSDQGKSWNRFCRRAEAFCSSQPLINEAVSGAAATFDCFYEYLARE